MGCLLSKLKNQPAGSMLAFAGLTCCCRQKCFCPKQNPAFVWRVRFQVNCRLNQFIQAVCPENPKNAKCIIIVRGWIWMSMKGWDLSRKCADSFSLLGLHSNPFSWSILLRCRAPTPVERRHFYLSSWMPLHHKSIPKKCCPIVLLGVWRCLSKRWVWGLPLMTAARKTP